MSNFRVEIPALRGFQQDTNIRIIKVPTEIKSISKALDYIKAVKRDKESFVIQVGVGEYKENLNIDSLSVGISIQGLGIHPSQTRILGKITVNIKSDEDSKELCISNILCEETFLCTNAKVFLDKVIIKDENEALKCINSNIICINSEIRNNETCQPSISLEKSELNLMSCIVDNESFSSPSLVVRLDESILICNQCGLYGSIESSNKSLVEIRNSNIIVDTKEDDTDVFITKEGDEIHLFYTMISGDTENIKVGEGKSVRAGVIALSKAQNFVGGENIKLEFV
jgi:hypothetical protein